MQAVRFLDIYNDEDEWELLKGVVYSSEEDHLQ